LVIHSINGSQQGIGLYQKMGYRQVGVFEKEGIMDGEFIDVMIMEKLL